MNAYTGNVRRSLSILLMFMMLFTMSGIHTYADGEAPFAVKTLTDGIVTVTTNDPEFMATSH